MTMYLTAKQLCRPFTQHMYLIVCLVLVDHKSLWHCIDLFAGEFVAQFKFTVLLMNNGPLRITSGPFDAECIDSSFSLQDEELKVWNVGYSYPGNTSHALPLTHSLASLTSLPTHSCPHPPPPSLSLSFLFPSCPSSLPPLTHGPLFLLTTPFFLSLFTHLTPFSLSSLT